MGSRQKVAAGMVIYRFLGEFEYLLLKASYLNHHWSPPKGHVDPGETDFEAAVRETEEEAGIKRDKYEVEPADTTSPFFTLKYPVKGVPKSVHYWIAKLKDPHTPVQLSDEHTDYKWANLDTSLDMTKEFLDFKEELLKVDEYLKSKSS